MQEAFIETERLILRAWRNEELESFAALYADPRVMEHWVVKTREESTQEFHHLISHMKKYGWGFWAVELKDSHQLIGLTGIENIPFQAHFTPAVEIGAFTMIIGAKGMQRKELKLPSNMVLISSI